MKILCLCHIVSMTNYAQWLISDSNHIYFLIENV